MTVIKEVHVDGFLEGLSGKKLKLGNWENRDKGKFRVGVKKGYELFPKPLTDRLKTERKQQFDIQQRNAINSLRK